MLIRKPINRLVYFLPCISLLNENIRLHVTLKIVNWRQAQITCWKLIYHISTQLYLLCEKQYWSKVLKFLCFYDVVSVNINWTSAYTQTPDLTFFDTTSTSFCGTEPTYLSYIFFSQKYTFEKCYGSILLLILGSNVICVVDTAQRNRNIWGDVKSNMFFIWSLFSKSSIKCRLTRNWGKTKIVIFSTVSKN